MKLYEGAVFLIIGAAVLGPVKPAVQWVPREVAAEMVNYCEQFKRDHAGALFYGNGGALEGCRPWGREYETTAETCARAMREIGAIRETVPLMTASPGTVLETGRMVVNKTPVLCIPSPTGLKR